MRNVGRKPNASMGVTSTTAASGCSVTAHKASATAAAPRLIQSTKATSFSPCRRAAPKMTTHTSVLTPVTHDPGPAFSTSCPANAMAVIEHHTSQEKACGLVRPASVLRRYGAGLGDHEPQPCQD